MLNAPPDLFHVSRSGPAARGGHLLAVRSVLRLQQSIGNREVVRLLMQDAPMPPLPRAGATAIEAPVESTVVAASQASVVPWRQRVALAWGRLSARHVSEPKPIAGPHGDSVIEPGDEPPGR